MNVLALDTATPSPSVSLLAEGRLFEEALALDRRASEELLPAVARLLAAAGQRIGQIGQVAVCAGPGSFTGARVGLATAWGFARAAGLAVQAVSTLEAMAEAARPSGASRVVAVLEAGRGEVVCERFSLERARARSLAPAALLKRGKVADFAAGEPIVALPDGLLDVETAAVAVSVASALALAVARAPRSGPDSGLKAIYSRPSAAEEKRGAP